MPSSLFRYSLIPKTKRNFQMSKLLSLGFKTGKMFGFQTAIFWFTLDFNKPFKRIFHTASQEGSWLKRSSKFGQEFQNKTQLYSIWQISKIKWLFWTTAWNLILWVTKCLHLCPSIDIFFLSALISFFIFFQNSRYIAIAWFQFIWLQHFQQESHELVS